MIEHAWDRTIVCHPDDGPVIEAAMETLVTTKRHRVLRRLICPRETLYVIDDERIDSELELPFDFVAELRPTPPSFGLRLPPLPIHRPTSFVVT